MVKTWKEQFEEEEAKKCKNVECIGCRERLVEAHKLVEGYRSVLGLRFIPNEKEEWLEMLRIVDDLNCYRMMEERVEERVRAKLEKEIVEKEGKKK
jgi:hypothetical protein